MKPNTELLYYRILNEQALDLDDIEKQEKEREQQRKQSGQPEPEEDNVLVDIKRYGYYALIAIGVIVAGAAVARLPRWLGRVAADLGLASRGAALRYVLAKVVVGEAKGRLSGFFPRLSKYIQQTESTFGRELKSAKTDAQLRREYGVNRNQMREILDELSHINWPLWSDNMRDLARQQYLSGQLPLDQFLALEGSLAKPGAANVARVWMPILQDAYLGRGVMRPVPLTNFGSINPTSFANYLSDGARRVRLLTRFGPEFARLVPVDLVTRMAIQNASFSANNTTVSSWINRVLTEVNRAARNNVRIGQRVVELSNQRGGRFPDYKKWRAIRHIQGNPTNFDAARGYDDYKMQKLIYMLWHAGL